MEITYNGITYKSMQDLCSELNINYTDFRRKYYCNNNNIDEAIKYLQKPFKQDWMDPYIWRAFNCEDSAKYDDNGNLIYYNNIKATRYRKERYDGEHWFKYDDNGNCIYHKSSKYETFYIIDDRGYLSKSYTKSKNTKECTVYSDDENKPISHYINFIAGKRSGEKEYKDWYYNAKLVYLNNKQKIEYPYIISRTRKTNCDEEWYIRNNSVSKKQQINPRLKWQVYNEDGELIYTNIPKPIVSKLAKIEEVIINETTQLYEASIKEFEEKNIWIFEED